MEKSRSVSTKYVDVLDGIRAISVIIVLIFHFWQQTWIFPTIKTPFLGFIGIRQIDFTAFARVGYLFVDMMILISGFLLFLPVARNVLSGEPLEKWRVYFRKRAARILPSYSLCIILLFIYAIAKGKYAGSYPSAASAAIKDLVYHLLFIHNWTISTYLSTPLNVVLWTLGVEVWFYILFPLIASFIKRRKKEKTFSRGFIRACTAAAVMTGITAVYIYCYALKPGSGLAVWLDGVLYKLHSSIRSDYPSMVINQLPAFLGNYAIGMLGAFAYVAMAKRLKRGYLIGAIGTALSILFIVIIVKMVKGCASLQLNDQQIWQLTHRLSLALVFMGFILSTAFSLGFWRFLFSNKVMVFLSAISYNLYIWHQWLAVFIKNDLRLPAWQGDEPPNQWGTPEGRAWSWKYALIITLASFGVATLITYLYERPIADRINGKNKLKLNETQKAKAKETPKKKK